MAIDRLMARLIAVTSDRWLLKGAVALQLKLTEQARTTKDLDIAHQEDEAAATADLIAAQAIDLGDFFQFSIERTQAIQEEEEPLAIRYRVRAELAGRRFEEFNLDVGIGRSVPVSAETLRGPDFFAFADLPPIDVPALPLEYHVAEKIHAYTRGYGEGRTNSRVKDLVDLVLIRSTVAFNAGRLREAIDRVFQSRNTHESLTALPPPPTDWNLRYRTQASQLNLDADVQVGFQLASDFINPILSQAIPDTADWDPIDGLWQNQSNP
jgi:hypothetical protein